MNIDAINLQVNKKSSNFALALSNRGVAQSG